MSRRESDVRTGIDHTAPSRFGGGQPHTVITDPDSHGWFKWVVPILNLPPPNVGEEDMKRASFW
jgi:hypothetical protein